LGRKPKNKFEEVSLVFKEGTKIKRYDVKIPFLYSITVESNDPNTVKWHNTREYFVKDDSNLDKLIKEIESDETFKVKVVKVESAVRQFIDHCPKCHKRGVPKIEKKNTSDNRERSWRNKEKISTQKKKEPEFWFTYTHTKMKKCRICQYVNTPAPAYKHNKINIEQYFFPYVLGNLKSGSVKYDQEQ
jgi:hypothetical protein